MLDRLCLSREVFIIQEGVDRPPIQGAHVCHLPPVGCIIGNPLQLLVVAACLFHQPEVSHKMWAFLRVGRDQRTGKGSIALGLQIKIRDRALCLTFPLLVIAVHQLSTSLGGAHTSTNPLLIIHLRSFGCNMSWPGSVWVGVFEISSMVTTVDSAWVSKPALVPSAIEILAELSGCLQATLYRGNVPLKSVYYC